MQTCYLLLNRNKILSSCLDYEQSLIFRCKVTPRATHARNKRGRSQQSRWLG